MNQKLPTERMGLMGKTTGDPVAEGIEMNQKLQTTGLPVGLQSHQTDNSDTQDRGWNTNQEEAEMGQQTAAN